MEKKIFKFIKDNNLIIKEPIICATSGGVDSVCLVTILNKLGYKVVLAHVNHHKRIESETEEAAMKSLANKLNIPFEVLEYHYDSLDNFHNDSHNARYNFFRSLCDKYHTDTIATAHHLDDQIETILMKIMEGSNLYGYGGISIVNDDGNYRIIRPLMCVDKNELYNYAKDNDLEYFEDKSNKEDDFLRNRLRHHIVPLLKNECVDINNKIYEYSIQVKEAFDYIRKGSISYLNDNNDMIYYESYKNLDIALKKDIISLMLEKNNIRKNNNIILDLVNVLNDNNGTKTIDLENGYCFIRSYDRAYIDRLNDVSKNEYILDINDEIIFDGKYKFYFTKNILNHNVNHIRLCYNKLNLPFKIRTKKDGDFIKLNIGNKKLNRLFIDKKIDKLKRDFIPIILDNNDNVLWVYNYAKNIDIVDYKTTGDIYLVCEEI